MQLYTIDIRTIEFTENEIIVDKTKAALPLKDYISEERLLYARRFKGKEDQKRSMCAAYLLNKALGENDVSISLPAKIAYEKLNGKPYLKDAKQLYFNVSHSGDMVALVLHDKPVGIDIEQCRGIKENVASRFFTKREYEDICSKNGEAKDRCFYSYWVLKESFLKATGYGMKLSMNEFEVIIENPVIYEHRVNTHTYEGQLFEPAEGYMMAVCREV